MLSVVITTWNEAARLPRVVKSVSGIADEIVVVDTESTDSTLAVAKKLGCRVFTHPNTKIVEPVRNFSISKAKGDWILVLDADEEVPPSLATQISHIVSQNQIDCVKIPRRSLIFGSWITSSHWWPDYVYRLFKKGHVIWQDAIHSVPQVTGTSLELPPVPENSLTHYHYETISQFIERLNRYTDVQSQELFSQKHPFQISDLVTAPAREFVNQFFARKAYQDGLHGLALSLLQAFSQLVLYLKIWQLQGFPSQPLDLKELESTFNKTHQEQLWWFYQKRIQSATPISRLVLKLTRRLKI